MRASCSPCSPARWPRAGSRAVSRSAVSGRGWGRSAALLLVAAGALLSAASRGEASLMCGQAVLGFGSGAFFVPGIRTAAQLAGARRGLAIGIFGVAFSGGVALAGLLASLGDLGAGARRSRQRRRSPSSWRGGARSPASPHGSRHRWATRPFAPVRRSSPWRWAERMAALQYGAVRLPPPLRGVRVGRLARHRRPRHHDLARPLRAREAPLRQRRRPRELGAHRPAPRARPRPARRLLDCGPWPAVGIVAAVVFGAFVAALGPVANVLALDAFEGRTQLLGAFRSVQIGFGTATSLLIGAAQRSSGSRRRSSWSPQAYPSRSS